MVNIMGLIFGLIAFLAVTFVIKSFVLQKEFDAVGSLVELAGVIVALWIAGLVVKKGLGKQITPKVQL